MHGEVQNGIQNENKKRMQKFINDHFKNLILFQIYLEVVLPVKFVRKKSMVLYFQSRFLIGILKTTTNVIIR